MNALKTALLLSVFSSCALMAQTNFNSELDSKIESLLEPLDIKSGGGIGVVYKDSVIYAKTFGYRDFEKKLPIVNTSPFYIASTSKTFIAVLAVKMANEGRLDFNKSIKHYLPNLSMGLKYREEDITIMDLLTHTQGFRNPPLNRVTAFTGLDDYSRIVPMLNEKSTALENREFRYNNLGSIIVATIIEKQAGKSWKDLLQEYIFSPLEMHDTSCYMSNYNFDDLVKTVDSFDGESYLDKRDNTLQPAGGIISTIGDMLKLISVFTNDGIFKGVQYLSKEDLRLMTSLHRKQDRMLGAVHRVGYGVGWDLAKFNEVDILTRDGGFQGLATSAVIIPSKNIGIIAFNNDREIHLAFYLPDFALNAYLGKENADEYHNRVLESSLRRKKRTDSIARARVESFPLEYPDKLEDVEGLYTSDTWGEVSFAAHKDTVFAHRGYLKSPVRTWEHDGKNYYFMRHRLTGRVFELTRPLGMKEGVYMHWNNDTLYFKKQPYKPYSQAHWVGTYNNNIKSLYTQYAEGAKVLVDGNVLEKEKDRQAYYLGLKENYGEILTYESLASEMEKGGYGYHISSHKTSKGKELIQLYITKEEHGFTQRIVELSFEKGKTSNNQLNSLTKARNRWIKLCNEHKSNELVDELYSSDAKYYNRGRLLATGSQLKNEYSYMSNPKYNLHLEPLHVIPVNKNIVYEIGQCSGSYKGKYVLVWKKEKEGSWKVFFDSNY